MSTKPVCHSGNSGATFISTLHQNAGSNGGGDQKLDEKGMEKKLFALFLPLPNTLQLGVWLEGQLWKVLMKSGRKERKEMGNYVSL